MNICAVQKNTRFRILNIFNDSRPASLLNIAQKIKNITGKRNIINLANHYSINHNPTCLSISNRFAKSSLNWRPLFSLEKIIKKLISHYESKKKI